MPMIAFLVRDKTIAIIGAGHLGTAVIQALYGRGHTKIIATRRESSGSGLQGGTHLDYLINTYQGIESTTHNVNAVQRSDIVILTVKPYVIEEVSTQIAQAAQEKLVVSLAAARSLC